MLFSSLRSCPLGSSSKGHHRQWCHPCPPPPQLWVSGQARSLESVQDSLFVPGTCSIGAGAGPGSLLGGWEASPLWP